MHFGVRLFVLFLMAAVSAVCFQAGPSKSTYHQRRQRLRKDLDGVFVLFGTTSKEEDQLRNGFIQEPSFNYLTGWQQSDAIIILSKANEIMFLPAHDERYERYYGHRISPSDADVAAVTGFSKVLSRSDFEAELLRMSEAAKIVYTIPAEPQSAVLPSLFLLRKQVQFRDGAAKVNAMRQIKSPLEIALIEKSASVSVEAHLVALRRMRPLLWEYQIAATMENTWRERGCERPAYTSIIGSGPNAVVLHYSADSRQIRPGELVVIDAAAECSSYAADITRTLPAGGRFSPRQQELYKVVLGAQEAAIRAVKPGAIIGNKDTAGSLMKIAFDFINTHGKDRNGKPLGQYVLHGLSYHIGLDVHDPGDIMKPLAAGMVISIEPGIYIRDESLGIRIEDMVLVTESGCRVLTRALPKDPQAIEKFMAHNN
jgi:Xaa-Pro aminopeptidase